MKDYQHEFIDFAIGAGVLRFGDFTLKSGRVSPYFFNAGLFNTGAQLALLGRFYAQAIMDSGIEFDVLFGPAYKGIPLAATTAIALADHHQRDVPWCFNRKETKAAWRRRQPGRGGPGRQGTDYRRCDYRRHRDPGGSRNYPDCRRHPHRRGNRTGPPGTRQGTTSAIQEVEETFAMTVTSIVTLQQLLEYLRDIPEQRDNAEKIQAYRDQYGV